MPFAEVTPTEMKISRAQAIALAERYLLERGLARQPRLEQEAAGQFLSWLNFKHLPGELQPRAWSASRSAAGWSVVFRHGPRQPGQPWGRVLTVDPFGRKIRIEPRELAAPPVRTDGSVTRVN